MKQVLYRKAVFGRLEGEVYACFPVYRSGYVDVFGAEGESSLSLGYFTDCMEDATPEESAAIRKKLESLGHDLEEICYKDFMKAMFSHWKL